MAIKCMVLPWLLMTTAVSVHAQSCESYLQGHVRSASLDAPLPFAQIFVRSNNLRLQTDEKGFYSIANLCPDQSYVLEINYLSRRFQVETRPAKADFDIVFPADSTVLKEVLIAGQQVEQRQIETVCFVDRADISAKQALSLTEMVRQLPGVSALQTGSNIAKPVIQGLHSNRIAIVNNGVVLESQQWGREHAPEIDAFSAYQVSVIKGATGVKYGVGAMGGAIVLEPEPLRPESGWGGWVTAGGFSNGRSGVMAGSLDYRSGNRQWAARVQATAKRGGNMRAPNYWLHNTGHAEYNVAGMAEWKPGGRWQHELTFSSVTQQLAVLRASHLGNVEQILQATQLDTPINNINRFTYALDRPYQGIEHYSGRWKTAFRPNDDWRLTAAFTHQFNHRREYDVVRKTGAAADKPQVSFRLWTNTLDVQAEHLGGEAWRSEGGIQLFQATNYVNRGAFIPDYNAFGGSLWAVERWHRHEIPWEWELGVRYDFRASHVVTEGNGSRNIDRWVQFGNVSGTTGVHYHLNERATVTLHSGYAWRPPSVYELFAQGVHHGAGTYEEGDSSLVSEKAWNTNLSFQYTAPGDNGWQIAVSVYRNAIRDFIYLDPQNTVKVTVRGPFPAYFYKQADAVFTGLDAQVSAPLWAGLALESRLSLLHADRIIRSTDGSSTRRDPLPLMPANRVQYGVKWQKKNLTVRAMAQSVARQTRIPEAGLLMSAPEGFTTFSADVLYSFQRGKRQWELGLSGQNLTNVRYREYLNFFRFYADEPGFNLGIRAKCTF